MASQGTVKKAAAAKTTARAEQPKPQVKTFDYAKFRQSFKDPAVFYQYLAGYPDDSGLMGYLYRVKPRIDLSLIGLTESSILKTSKRNEMTEEFVSGRFGNGDFMLKLTDSNKPRGQQEVCRTWFVIDEPHLKPIYDPRTLILGEARNMDEVQRLIADGTLIRDAHGVPRLRTSADTPGPVSPPVPAPPAAAPPPPQLIDQNFLAQVLVGALNRSQQNPHDMVKDTIEVARLIHPPTPVIDEERIVQRIKQELSPAGPGDLFSSYEKVEGFLNKFRPAGSENGSVIASGGFSSDAWAQNLPAIIGQGRAFLAEIMVLWRSTRQNGNHQNGNGSGSPAGAGAPLAPASAGVDAAVSFNQRLETVIRDALAKMNEGVLGFDYAGYL